MRKYVWFLIAAAFALAVFAMVGCRPAGTPAVSPSPTVTPTQDTRCPQPVSTVVRNLYNPVTGKNKGEFEIVITFDEPIAGDDDCIEDPKYWTVTVENATRKGDVTVTDIGVTLSADGKKITITAKAEEKITGQIAFPGLICTEEDAANYQDLVDLALEEDDGDDYAKVADLVKWKLSAWCSVYDELGNTCCGFEGEACCSPVCEPVTPPSGCPL